MLNRMCDLHQAVSDVFFYSCLWLFFGLLQLLLDKGVLESKILFLTLIAAPEGIHKICVKYPQVKVIPVDFLPWSFSNLFHTA